MFVGIAIGVLEVMGIWHWIAPSWCLPTLIFFMLLLTFCKINPLELRLYTWHWILLAFQVVVSLLLFYLLRPIDIVLAQGVMLCVLMPSATAAPIIAAKLGGSIKTLTSFTLLSSVSTAVLVPLIFPLITHVDTPFLQTFILILSRISPLLIAPFLIAWLIRVVWNIRVKDRPFVLPDSLASLPFYLWVCTLTILMAKMTRDLFAYDGSWLVLTGMFVGALITCLVQFLFGKYIGTRFPSEANEASVKETRICAGQALGQKNTTLAIWMAATYLHPISALAPAAYIIWQNLFNAWQLAKMRD